jgi:hypothetical protein
VSYPKAPPPGDQVLGSPVEAMEALRVDAADLWELVAAGELTASRPDDRSRWTISRPRRTP